MWSPRELAELAGTSRRAVRHYDEIGLLPEPDRQSNGYGRYGVDHLIRLLRIRRLSSLGLTLPQIAALGDSQPPAALVEALDAELSGRMEELRQAREELSSLLEHSGPVELPAGVAHLVARLPSAERALVVVLSRLLDEEALDTYVGLLGPYRENTAVVAFDNLAEESEGAARVDLAQDLADHYHRFRSQHHAEFEMIERVMRRGAAKQRTMDEAVRELYNPAQRDVLQRIHTLQPQPAPVRRQREVSRPSHPRSAAEQLRVPA